jgi:hypothetical protein
MYSYCTLDNSEDDGHTHTLSLKLCSDRVVNGSWPRFRSVPGYLFFFLPFSFWTVRDERDGCQSTESSLLPDLFPAPNGYLI